MNYCVTVNKERNLANFCEAFAADERTAWSQLRVADRITAISQYNSDSLMCRCLMFGFVSRQIRQATT